MKTKNKLLTAIVLCTLLLIALPSIGIATAQKDETLDIYGNANEDDTIDMRDLTYVKLIFFGKKPETELSDAKYDGKINPLDFVQIKLIIVGKEKQLTLIDSADRIVTVKKPVERIILFETPAAAAIRVLEYENKVIGVGTYLTKKHRFLPVISEQPAVGSLTHPDIEAMLALNPDIVMVYGSTSVELYDEKLGPSVTVIRLNLYNKYSPKTAVNDLEKLGYILGKVEEAEEFIDWFEGYMDTIKDRTEGLSEEDKPRVYIDRLPYYYKDLYRTYSKESDISNQCILAGGINIAGDLPGFAVTVDPEWILEQNPDFIFQIVGISRVPTGYEVDDITGLKEAREDLMKRSELQNINAVKNENVYALSIVISSGLQTMLGTAYFAKLLHPDLFEDLDPQAIQQEYLDKFHRIDLDVKKQGAFIYPPLEG